VIFGLFIYARLSQGLWATADNTLRLNAAQVITAIEFDDNQFQLTENEFENIITSELLERGLTFRLFAVEGDLIQSAGAYAALPLNRNNLATAQQGRDTFRTIPDPYDDERIRIYSVPIIREGTVVGMLEVAQSLERVDDALEQLKTALLIGGPLLSLIAGGGSYLLAARALARIDRITQTVRRISAEDLSTRLNFPAIEDEVGRLATTFDDMLERLDESFQRERRFTADASHELRTPIAAIQVIVGTTLENRRTTGEYEQALVDVAEEASRLRSVTENLLLLARSDSQQPIMSEPVNLSVLLQDITESLRPLAEDKGLTIHLIDDGQLSLHGDSDQLIRLFVNLVDNAIKYTDQGSITIKAQRISDNRVRITVADTGCGISAEHLPHVFERFYRVDASRSTHGVGLGLTIAQEIAQAHGGAITVKSEVGVGTTFVVGF
jgi:heavy metal sensor kinase